MKIDRHGRAKILTQAEIQRLFAEGFRLLPLRDRTLFAVCLYRTHLTSLAGMQ